MSTSAPPLSDAPTTTQRLRRWPLVLGWTAVITALAGVFLLYLQPEFMVLMANQVWACF